MGLPFSKPDKGLEFTILPSAEVSGPLGLGDPDSEELTSIEQQVIIPALMVDRIRTKQCVALWDEWALCTENYRWSAVIFCRRLFQRSINCNKR
ncbi:unnamed protein product [Calicophoron daubneyi]